MKCKHCGRPENDLEHNSFTRMAGHKFEPVAEPASPVAQPEKERSRIIKPGDKLPTPDAEYKDWDADKDHITVAQSGTKGLWPTCDFCGSELEKQVSGAGRCPRCGAMKFRPSSPSGQAAAPGRGFWKDTTQYAEALASAHTTAPSISTQLAVEFLELKRTVAASPTGGAEPPKMEISTKEYGNLLAIWQTALMLFGGPPDEFPDVERMRYRMHQATTPAAAAPSAWPSDLPADGMGAMNLITNFWTGDLKGLTKEGARIVDSLVAHVTKGLRDEVYFFQREYRNGWQRNCEAAEAQLATALEALRKLIADKEPNGYPLWFNRTVRTCKLCDSEDLCTLHHQMAGRDFTDCEEEIDEFMAELGAV